MNESSAHHRPRFLQLLVAGVAAVGVDVVSDRKVQAASIFVPSGKTDLAPATFEVPTGGWRFATSTSSTTQEGPF